MSLPGTNKFVGLLLAPGAQLPKTSSGDLRSQTACRLGRHEAGRSSAGLPAAPGWPGRAARTRCATHSYPPRSTPGFLAGRAGSRLKRGPTHRNQIRPGQDVVAGLACHLIVAAYIAGAVRRHARGACLSCCHAGGDLRPDAELKAVSGFLAGLSAACRSSLSSLPRRSRPPPARKGRTRRLS
jgi:hypothetical protein